jgi:lipopolysaccharide/colanic/teichoic acid biosynthesis glycosyltransferase
VDFSRLVFGIGSVIALGTMSAVRLALGQAIGRRCRRSFRRDILILDGIAANATGNEVVIDAGSERLHPRLDDPAALDRIGQLLHRSERVIVACPPDRREAWTRALAGANVDVEILAPELSGIPAIGLRRHGAVPSLLVGCGPLRLRNRVMKRVLDLSVASGSLVLFAPLMLLIAAAIRLGTDGPVLFRQVRMGRGNRMFTMLKFRTMRSEAADGDGTQSVCRDDKRLTRVGRFLRRTSLDELPQLFNVLKGDMSIVGPRPHALGTRAGHRLLWAIDDRYWDRHAIKPGLTGLAQVRGLRGATETTAALTDRLQADLDYIDRWHVGRDVAIMLRTLGVLIHPKAF